MKLLPLKYRISIFPEGTLQSSKKAFLYILILTFLTRLPYFFKADINWDEATFILIGQSVLDGHLPYTDLLDNKSPLLWYTFAALIWLSGKSFALLRLFGSFYVAFIAFINYLIAKKIWQEKTALITSILTITMIDVASDGQAIMSEHLALLPLMLGFLCMISYTKNCWLFFGSGFFLGLASLIRLNLVYTILFIGIYIFIISCQDTHFNARKIFLNCLSFFSGFIVSLIIVSAPHLFQGKIKELYAGFIQAPLNYTTQNNLLQTLHLQSSFIGDVLTTKISIAFSLIFLGILFGFILQIKQIFTCSEPFAKEEKRLYILSLVYMVSIELSILKSGVFFNHYMIQFIPILTLIASPAIAKLIDKKRRNIVLIGILLGTIFLVHLSTQYLNTANACLNTKSCLYGKSVEVATYLKEANPQGKPIWLTENHLAHWFTNTYPIIPEVTHPSNINREVLLKGWHDNFYTSLNAIEVIISKKPYLILINDYEGYLQNPDAQKKLSESIKKNYFLKGRIANSLDVYEINP